MRSSVNARRRFGLRVRGKPLLVGRTPLLVAKDSHVARLILCGSRIRALSKSQS